MNNKVQLSKVFLLPGEAKTLRVFIGNRAGLSRPAFRRAR